MTSLNNTQITSKEAANLCNISVPTLFRFSGTKVGLNGEVFPNPEKITNRLFAWDKAQIERWVSINGRALATKRGRPKGSTKSRSYSSTKNLDGFTLQYSVSEE